MLVQVETDETLEIRVGSVTWEFTVNSDNEVVLMAKSKDERHAHAELLVSNYQLTARITGARVNICEGVRS